MTHERQEEMSMRIRPLVFTIVLAMALAACGSDDGTSSTTTGDDTGATGAPTATTAPDDDAGTTTAAEMDGVHTAENDLGSVLVDGDGFTLYVFTNDTDGTSTCNDACADVWPPVPADTAIGSELDTAMFGTTTRDDGSEQLTVNGMPLYLYTPDTAPGETNGQGLNGVWFVVDGSGSMIEAAADDAKLIDYGY
jgi:predicted lipoprotein with Yx(FWY)xxD motif